MDTANVNVKLLANPFEQKLAAFNGDSITQGYASEKPIYPEIVAGKLGMRLANAAIGGAMISAPEYPDLFDASDPDHLTGQIVIDGNVVHEPAYNTTGFIDISGYPTAVHSIIQLISSTAKITSVRAYTFYDENKAICSSFGTETANAANHSFIMRQTLLPQMKFVRIAYPAEATDLEIRFSLRYPIIWRYQEMPADADLIVIAGGTNDHCYALTPTGTFEDRTPFTFYGAMHQLCLALLDTYVGKQIVFATPIKRHSGNHINSRGESLEQYADMIKEVCAFYGIPVLDMFRECTLNPGIPTQFAAFFADTSHPKQSGHEMMARRWTGYLKQLMG